MPDTFPDLERAAQQVVNARLHSRSDKLVRIEDATDLDVPKLASYLREDPSLRVAWLRPGSSSRDPVIDIETNPRTITEWRNERLESRAAAPIVVIGAADGPEEAGLRQFPRVSITDIIDGYCESVQAWLRVQYAADSRSPEALVHAICQLAKSSYIEPKDVERFCISSFADGEDVLNRPKEEMWRMGLLPDLRTMDPGLIDSRLRTNVQIAELLQYASDSRKDEAKIERLRSAANSGDVQAESVLAFRESGEYHHLSEVELDYITNLMGRKPNRPANEDPDERISLIRALDREGLIDDDILKRLAEGADLTDERIDTECETPSCKIRLLIDADFSASDDTYTHYFDSVATIEKKPAEEGAVRKITSSEIITHARDVARRIGDEKLEDLARELVAARDAITELSRWGRGQVELFLTRDDLRQAADTYVHAWVNIGEQLLAQGQHAYTRPLERMLLCWDADWLVEVTEEGAESIASAVLRPTHPYVLAPRIAVASYALENLGAKDLGAQVQWGDSRLTPSYPAIWMGEEALVHQDGVGRPRYEPRKVRERPDMDTGTGISEVVASYLGLHPYGKQHLSILLVDPPKGRGIPSALHAVTRRHEVSLTVYLVTTGLPTVDLADSSSIDVRHVGYISDLDQWLAKTSVRCNVAFWFVPACTSLVLTRHSGSPATRIMPPRRRRFHPPSG